MSKLHKTHQCHCSWVNLHQSAILRRTFFNPRVRCEISPQSAPVTFRFRNTRSAPGSTTPWPIDFSPNTKRTLRIFGLVAFDTTWRLSPATEFLAQLANFDPVHPQKSTQTKLVALADYWLWGLVSGAGGCHWPRRDVIGQWRGDVGLANGRSTPCRFGAPPTPLVFPE